MPYFSDLSEEINLKLIHYFKTKPVGTKIKCGTSIAIDASHNYVLKNSYIKLEKDIYALAKGEGAVLGEGAFGKVKYARSLSTNEISVIKIIPFESSDTTLDAIANELVILYDLGLYRDTGARDYGSQTKQYIVMADAGISLDDYLRLHPALNSSVRIDLAIKLCWLIYALHQGISSRTLHSYAHRDLKPANVALDVKGTLRLIDVGIASDKLDSLPAELAGAPGYLPSLMTLLKAGLTLRHLDILALKRVIYMPSKMLCLNGYKEDKTGKHFGLQRLMSPALLKELKVFTQFDTSASGAKQGALKTYQYNGDPLILASLLVLARYGLMEAYGPKMHNSFLACAVLGIYFANQNLSDELVRGNIASALVAYILSRVVPRYVPLANQVRLFSLFVSLGMTNNLTEALSNKTLINLIKMPSKSIPRAAALLWQNGFYEEELLAQLEANEELARKIISLIFDGDLRGVEKALSPPVALIVKPAEPRLTLPSIFSKPESASKDSRTPLTARVEPTSTGTTKAKAIVAGEKPPERLLPLFFALPKVRGATGTDFAHPLTARVAK